VVEAVASDARNRHPFSKHTGPKSLFLARHKTCGSQIALTEKFFERIKMANVLPPTELSSSLAILAMSFRRVWVTIISMRETVICRTSNSSGRGLSVTSILSRSPAGIEEMQGPVSGNSEG
jgi:hypothetical protein